MDQQDRQTLRRSARSARRAFVAALAPPVRAALEQQLAQRLAPFLDRGAEIATYAATGAEVGTTPLDPLIDFPCFPRVTSSGALRFHCATRPQLIPGAHGILEPPANAPLARPSVVLVPLLLFDRAGGRLGRGGGHYDRALRELRQAGPVHAIGLAWDLQETDLLTLAEWDERLDLVATPTRLIRCSSHPTALARPDDV